MEADEYIADEYIADEYIGRRRVWNG